MARLAGYYSWVCYKDVQRGAWFGPVEQSEVAGFEYGFSLDHNIQSFTPFSYYQQQPDEELTCNFALAGVNPKRITPKTSKFSDCAHDASEPLQRQANAVVAEYSVPIGAESERKSFGDVTIFFSTNRAEGSDFYLHVESESGGGRYDVFEGQAQVMSDGISGLGPYRLTDGHVRKIYIQNGQSGVVNVKVVSN